MVFYYEKNNKELGRIGMNMLVPRVGDKVRLNLLNKGVGVHNTFKVVDVVICYNNKGVEEVAVWVGLLE